MLERRGLETLCSVSYQIQDPEEFGPIKAADQVHMASLIYNETRQTIE